MAPSQLLSRYEIDTRAIDPRFGRKTPIVGTRLGPREKALLDRFAAELNLTRSKLARQLLAKSLRELEAGVI